MSIALALVISGCSNAPQKKSSSDLSTQDLSPIGSQSGAIQHSLDDPDVAVLWTRAELAREEKQFAEASFHIEQALRVIPDDPVLWSRLAELQMLQEETVLAENYAAKSNALASDNRPLQHRNWLIIQHARDKRGDVLGAREAQVEVRNLSEE
ncbi:MAG: hypothetical protein AAF434_04415 [Pseudomonadota bacterium]